MQILFFLLSQIFTVYISQKCTDLLQTEIVPWISSQIDDGSGDGQLGRVFLQAWRVYYSAMRRINKVFIYLVSNNPSTHLLVEVWLDLFNLDRNIRIVFLWKQIACHLSRNSLPKPSWTSPYNLTNWPTCTEAWRFVIRYMCIPYSSHFNINHTNALLTYERPR